MTGCMSRGYNVLLVEKLENRVPVVQAQSDSIVAWAIDLRSLLWMTRRMRLDGCSRRSHNVVCIWWCCRCKGYGEVDDKMHRSVVLRARYSLCVAVRKKRLGEVER